MSLRPRYSLLTLLVLMALVAGGVKLWYGPHHVVERPATDRELEYSYTRDWRGNKVVQGPCVIRILEPDESVQFIHVTFIRHGEALPCHYTLQKNYYFNLRQIEVVFNDEGINKLQLQPQERAQFLQAIETERSRKKHSSTDWWWVEELDDIPLNLDLDFVDFGNIDAVAEILSRASF